MDLKQFKKAIDNSKLGKEVKDVKQGFSMISKQRKLTIEDSLYMKYNGYQFVPIIYSGNRNNKYYKLWMGIIDKNIRRSKMEFRFIKRKLDKLIDKLRFTYEVYQTEKVLKKKFQFKSNKKFLIPKITLDKKILRNLSINIASSARIVKNEMA